MDLGLKIALHSADERNDLHLSGGVGWRPQRHATCPQPLRGGKGSLAMHKFIARQPILDRSEKVYGYELNSRGGEDDLLPPLEGEAPAVRPASGELPCEGFDEFLDQSLAFIKCPPAALLDGRAARLPKDRVVLEIPVGRAPDEGVVVACRHLKAAGFTLALDNYQGGGDDPLAEMANLIKMDVSASADRVQWLLIRKLRAQGVAFVAQNLQKHAQFQNALQQGYNYFQGPFYCRPQPYSPSDVTPTKLVYLLVLRAVTRPEIDMQEVAEAIKHDLALSYKLLRFLNSARFAFHSRITSIRHALLMLGQNEIRKWIGLISLAALGEGGPPILVKMALVRAAFCEFLAPLVGASKRESDYFFLGLLSCIDVLLRRPMRVVLAELPMLPDVAAALVGEQNPLREVLHTVVSYEQGDWDECCKQAKKLALKEEALAGLHLRSLRWSRELNPDEKGQPADSPPAPALR